MIHFDMQNMSVTPVMGQIIVDQAVMDGRDKRALRWRVGKYALHAIQSCLWQVSDFQTLRYETEKGLPDHGMFAGVPFAFDSEVADEAMVLDVVLTTEPVTIVRHCAITRYDDLMLAAQNA